MTMCKTLTSLVPLALAISIGGAQAVPVSVTAEFTSFQMGAFVSQQSADNLGLLVNGSNVVFDAAAAFLNPLSVSRAISGSQVSFGYIVAAQRGGNTFGFTAAAPQEVSGRGAGNSFLLGSFSFTNGAFHPLSYINFEFTTHSSDAAFDGIQLAGRVRLDVNATTTNFLDPALRDRAAKEEADYFTLQSANGQTFASLGSVRVFDVNRCLTADLTAPNCNTGSVDVYGYIDSLHFDHFANATGGAFLDSSVTGALTPPAPVPEPGSAALMFAGLVVAGLARVRRDGLERRQ
jgi:hypothetical protein